MGTLFDYINWRGDLSFHDSPFNEVDSLIFSLISYIDLKGIVSQEHDGDLVPIKAAANAFFAQNPDPKKISMGIIVPKDIIKLFRALKDTRRFSGVNIKAYVNHIDRQEETQFSAMTFLIDQNKTLIAYRGTDDTLVGWKENFNMSFLSVVPAQKEAVHYLNCAAEHSAHDLMLAGHSKGGNLAVYASVHCNPEIKKRLTQVWSHDGPGFGPGMLNNPEYIKMKPIIKSLVPQSSIVGMLLEHDESYTVVKSRQPGVFQHDGLSWNIMGNSFIRLKNVTSESKRLDKTLNEWIKAMTPEQREQFVDALYQLLSSDNALTLTDLVSVTKNKWLQKSSKLDPHVHKTIQKTLAVLFSMNTKSIIGEFLHKAKPKSDSDF